MAIFTANLSMTKPDLTDARDIRILNANFDILDGTLPSDSAGRLKVRAGGTPAVTVGAALGTSPPAAVQTGNDSRGKITFGTGTSTTTGTLLTVTFSTTYGTAPACVQFTPATAVSATNALQMYVSSITATTFVLSCVVAPTASQGNTIYGFYYTVIA